MIVIVDSGGANLLSLSSALSRFNTPFLVSADKEEILKASHVILPGVGSAKGVMNRLHSLGLVDVLKQLSQPLLGICVGMQILFEYSEEESSPCLGILQGSVKKLNVKSNLSLPHMGWNTLIIKQEVPLFHTIPEAAYVYFVHNFAAPMSRYTIAETQYGCPFSSAVQAENFIGVQFHPERSAEVGHLILKNFLEGVL